MHQGDIRPWFSNFHVHRQQRVLLDGSNSEWTEVKSGVLQGSILRPSLYITCVNDIPSKLSSPNRLLQMTAQSTAKLVICAKMWLYWQLSHICIYYIYICEFPRKNSASCIIAYCSGSGINTITNKLAHLCGMARGTVNRCSESDRSLRELSFDT